MAEKRNTRPGGGPNRRGPKRDGKGPHGPGRKNQNKPCPRGNR